MDTFSYELCPRLERLPSAKTLACPHMWLAMAKSRQRATHGKEGSRGLS